MDESGPSNSSGSSRSRSFKRSYVACVSCRTRKARCIIGDKPPCAKCQREHRECHFDHRPKGFKHREAPKWAKGSGSRAPAARMDPSPTQWRTADDPPALVAPGQGFATQFAHGHDHVPAMGAAASSDECRGVGQTSPETDSSLYERVRSTVVTGTSDALDILSDAVIPQHHNLGPQVAAQQQSQSGQNRPLHAGPEAAPSGHTGLGFTVLSLSDPDDEILDLWDKSRFVRQGSFTAQEAVTYIDLFYKYLAPLSPVVLTQFCDHEAHFRLVHQEAMLCCTILMIASRFFMLPGAGGASRSHFIHHRLWQYCELLIKRIMLGQEKHSTAKMRAIGTIESLMLISDWHPRALHFPPETEGWDSLLISTDYDPRNRRTRGTEAPLIRWREDVFEPANRAHRMSWMLLGMATNLAYEIGILSNLHQRDAASPTDTEGFRKFRVQKLLFTYVSQAANRLGLPAMFHESVSIVTSRSSLSSLERPEDKAWMAYISLSIELVQLSRTASSMFFHSASHLQDLVLGDRYADLLEHFSASLSKWQEKLESARNDMSQLLRDSLLIEFYHLKACAEAVSIQAVVARASATGLNAVDGSSKDSLAAFITSRDARFLQDVVTDSKTVLRIATMTDFKHQLPYAPARVKINVISASVFLLKALSVGSTNTDAQDALYVLDQCTNVLKTSPPDDMDFALRYATLVEKHTSQFRAHLSSARPHYAGDISLRLNHGRADDTGNLPRLDATMNTAQPGFASDFGGFGLGSGSDEWISLPFDSSIAPFNSESDQLALGLDVDSLNFLWSLPDLDTDAT